MLLCNHRSNRLRLLLLLRHREKGQNYDHLLVRHYDISIAHYIESIYKSNHEFGIDTN